jgi:hypothetical protein
MVEPIVGNVHEGVGGAAEKYKNKFYLVINFIHNNIFIKDNKVHFVEGSMLYRA